MIFCGTTLVCALTERENTALTVRSSARRIRRRRKRNDLTDSKKTLDTLTKY